MTETATVQLSEKAAQQIKKMTTTSPGKSLRIFVEAGGCSGLQYGMELSERKDGDLELTDREVPFFLDEQSSSYLKGSLIDYADGLAYTGFRITNPNAKQTCGCGTSFEA